MSFSDGEFVKIDYSMWRASDNSLIKTTEKAVAEKSGINDKDTKYASQLVVIGKDRTIIGILTALKSMNVGEKKKIELTPDQAFGLRDKDLVKIMSLADFRKKEIDPVPGMQIDMDGIIATVMSVNSGRVMVDANHPLAGERLVCEVKAVEKLDHDDKKLKAIAELFGLEPEKAEVKENIAKVTFGAKTAKNADYFVAKSQMTASAFAYMDNIKKIIVEEEFEKTESKPQKQ